VRSAAEKIAWEETKRTQYLKEKRAGKYVGGWISPDEYYWGDKGEIRRKK